jgi:hypothetical protein
MIRRQVYGEELARTELADVLVLVRVSANQRRSTSTVSSTVIAAGFEQRGITCCF